MDAEETSLQRGQIQSGVLQVSMIRKSGKWLADWRDSTGTRHRKAFTTEKAAARHQRKMAGETRKKEQRPRRRILSRSRGSKPRSAGATSTK